MLLSNKAILPILWEMFPDHPNLLPASFDRAKHRREPCVEKPVHGREGDGIRLLGPGAPADRRQRPASTRRSARCRCSTAATP